MQLAADIVDGLREYVLKSVDFDEGFGRWWSQEVGQLLQLVKHCHCHFAAAASSSALSTLITRPQTTQSTKVYAQHKASGVEPRQHRKRQRQEDDPHWPEEHLQTQHSNTSSTESAPAPEDIST
jgi:hypothetical protein